MSKLIEAIIAMIKALTGLITDYRACIEIQRVLGNKTLNYVEYVEEKMLPFGGVVDKVLPVLLERVEKEVESLTMRIKTCQHCDSDLGIYAQSDTGGRCMTCDKWNTFKPGVLVDDDGNPYEQEGVCKHCGRVHQSTGSCE